MDLGNKSLPGVSRGCSPPQAGDVHGLGGSVDLPEVQELCRDTWPGGVSRAKGWVLPLGDNNPWNAPGKEGMETGKGPGDAGESSWTRARGARGNWVLDWVSPSRKILGGWSEPRAGNGDGKGLENP